MVFSLIPNTLLAFVVADGMGGHKAGDFASKYTVEVLKEELKQYFKISEITPLSTFFDEEWFSQDKQLVYVPA